MACRFVVIYRTINEPKNTENITKMIHITDIKHESGVNRIMQFLQGIKYGIGLRLINFTLYIKTDIFELPVHSLHSLKYSIFIQHIPHITWGFWMKIRFGAKTPLGIKKSFENFFLHIKFMTTNEHVGPPLWNAWLLQVSHHLDQKILLFSRPN